jgi:hypothetical protein
MKRSWIGMLLILFGAVLLLDSLGAMNVGEAIRKFWPIILILIGLNMLWRKK